MLVRHLTQTFVALRLDLTLVASGIFLNEIKTLLIVPAILRIVAFGALVEGRHRNIEVTLLHERFHVAEEEGHNERSDMRTIHIGIGHDNHFVVTNLAQVECLGVLRRTNRYAQSRKDILDFFTFKHLMLHRFLYVEDLTAEREDSLMEAVSSGLGRTACRVTLHEEELAFSRVFALAVCQLTGQPTATQRRLALYVQAGVASCDTSLSGQHHFLYNAASIIRMLLQVVRKRLTYGLIHHARHL